MELQHRSHLIFLILSVATDTAALDVIDAKRKETPRNISQDSDGSGEDYIVGEPFLLHTLCSSKFLLSFHNTRFESNEPATHNFTDLNQHINLGR